MYRFEYTNESNPVNGTTLTTTAFDDVIKSGDGDDSIIGCTGNDVITGGKGVNTVKYTALEQLDGDKINLTKGEQLTIDISEIAGAEVTYTVNGKNLDVNVKKDEVTKPFTIVGLGTSYPTNNL